MLTQRRPPSRRAALVAAALAAFASAQAKATPACIWALGDSLTEGYQGELAKILPDRHVIAGGLPAQTSTQIAARAGVVQTRVSLAGGSVPASGAAEVTAIAPRLISSATEHDEIEGSLAGRPGKLTRDADDVYVFTPAPTENSTPAAPNSLFTPDTSAVNDCILILWAGQNNIPAIAQILADTDAILAPYQRRHKHFLVIGMVNDEHEAVGTPNFRTKMQLNRALAQRYSANYIDIGDYLVRLGLQDLNIVADPVDQDYIAKGVVPSKLRRDLLHPNEDGNRLIAKYLAAAIKGRQW